MYSNGLNGETQRINKINCLDYIQGPAFDQYSEAERQDAIDQLILDKYQWCPDLTGQSFNLKGAIYAEDGEGLIFRIVPLESTNQTIMDSTHTSMAV